MIISDVLSGPLRTSRAFLCKANLPPVRFAGVCLKSPVCPKSRVHSDGYATARWIDGEWVGMIAVCAIDKLEIMLLEIIVASSDR
jgi:hypothetical protein